MLDKMYVRYRLLEERLKNDDEMKDLRRRLEEEDKALSDLLSRLSEDDRGVIHETIGILGEMQERTMEVAAFGLEGRF